MVRFIYEHRKVFLPNAFDKPLLKLTGLGSPHCTTVSEATPVKEALRTLFEQNLNATAVVDAAGRMKACLEPLSLRSLSLGTKDSNLFFFFGLTCLRSDHRPDFNAPVGQFEVLGRDPGWVNPEQTLEDVLKKIVDHKLHRVWGVWDKRTKKKGTRNSKFVCQVSDAGAPMLIITLYDILKFTIDQHKN